MGVTQRVRAGLSAAAETCLSNSRSVRLRTTSFLGRYDALLWSLVIAVSKRNSHRPNFVTEMGFVSEPEPLKYAFADRRGMSTVSAK